MKEQEGGDAKMETGLQTLSLTDQEGFKDITDQLKRPKLAEPMEDKQQ